MKWRECTAWQRSPQSWNAKRMEAGASIASSIPWLVKGCKSFLICGKHLAMEARVYSPPRNRQSDCGSRRYAISVEAPASMPLALRDGSGNASAWCIPHPDDALARGALLFRVFIGGAMP